MTTDQRTLIILRHAKADRPSAVGDLDRPLTERGHADAGAAGVWLAARGYLPDLVICSPSKRTRQTWHGVAVALSAAAPAAPSVHYEPALYESGVDEILHVLKGVEPRYRVALVIGHNPTVSQLSALLDPRVGHDSDGLRTCGLAVHRWDGDWGAWGPGSAPLVAEHTARIE